ncbi:hypothetical protein [Kitasatospora sp. NBC_01266]|uniref:hypothetical protein n=1 Tax=Kitasatospora sp. NBC_01266 TaxID=2903572 RepID=UPI002E3090A6|nr:hypothetical protein [Kitasatospora sp. NBC_01266]
MAFRLGRLYGSRVQITKLLKFTLLATACVLALDVVLTLLGVPAKVTGYACATLGLAMAFGRRWRNRMR